MGVNDTLDVQDTSLALSPTKGTLVSRNITIFGRRTSVRLEPEMWVALTDISEREGCSIHELCSLIHLRKKPATSLTAAIRVFLMLYFRAAATDEGHRLAGQGNFEDMCRRARVDLNKFKPASRKGDIPESKAPSSEQEKITPHGKSLKTSHGAPE